MNWQLTRRVMGIVLVLATVAAGQAWEEVRPYVNERTVAVVHVPLAEVDADRAIAWAVEQVRGGAGDEAERRRLARDMGAGRQGAVDWVRRFRDAGGRGAWVTVQSDGAPLDMTLAVVTLRDPADAAGVAAALDLPLVEAPDVARPGQVAVRHGAVLLNGSPTRLARVDAAKAADRADLRAAFDAAEQMTVRVAVAPTADLRKVIRDVMPTLPAEWGGASTAPVSEGLQWISVGLKLPPGPSVRVIAHCSDAPAAEGLRALVADAMDGAAASRDVQQIVPDARQVFEQLKPRVDGTRLQLAIDERQLASVVVRPLANGLAQGREQAMRVKSMSNLRQIGVALYVHADKHNGEWPADWLAAVKAHGLTANELKNPRRPELEVGYEFVRPTKPLKDLKAGETIVAYERHDDFAAAGGVAALYADGHVQWIADRKQLEAGLAAGRE